MIQRRTLLSILLASVLIGIAPALSTAAPTPSQSLQEGTNLLTNPGFEGLSCPGMVPSATCKNYTHIVHIQDGIYHDNIETPEGWVTWWQEGGGYNQPEVVLMPMSNPNYSGNPLRIRSGFRAVKCFTFARNQNAGLYQVVTGLQPGATVQLSAYAHSWSCDSMDGDHGRATTCGDPWNMSLQVGIEPNGLADPFASSIVWSPDQYAPDVYQFIGPATAKVGASGSVVVYLRAITKWPFRQNDAYWDDVALVYTTPQAAATNTPQPTSAAATESPLLTATVGAPPTATAGPSPTPRPTPTPRPDGALVHVVEPGDTLSGIAKVYGVDVDQIRQLNAGSIGDGDLIVVGQELVISAPTPTPTLTPSPTSAPTSTPIPSPTSTSTPLPASPTPEASPTLIPTLAADATASRTSTPTPGVTGEGERSGNESGTSSVFSTVAKISGVIALILIVGIAVLLFLTRRKR